MNADGQSLVWAGRLLGVPVPERVAGIDLLGALLAAMEREGLSAYFLGARDEVIRTAVTRITERHPRLRVAGFHHGHFPPDEDEPSLPRSVKRLRRPLRGHELAAQGTLDRCVAAAHGSPFRHGRRRLLRRHPGLTKRAPALLQRLGLEWAYRTAQEPRRLAGRYARTNGAFVRLVAAELAQKRKRTGPGRA